MTAAAHNDGALRAPAAWARAAAVVWAACLLAGAGNSSQGATTRPAKARRAGSTTVAKQSESFGAETNPTGSPIGGGRGYNRLIEKSDVQVRGLDELAAALKRATPGQVIYVDDDAEIDLTVRVRAEQFVLEIPGGVTLAGGRGKAASGGALLYSDELRTAPLIRVAGAKARITGLRIRGPDPEDRTAEMKRLLSKGGHRLYYAFPTSAGIACAQPQLEVDNCELWGWSHAAVLLRSGAVDAHIHHNYLHHCKRSGLGYGVCLDQAVALIEANVFDWCRHCIAGTGRAGTSYEARYNLVLPFANSHSFDMHGGADRHDGTDLAGGRIRIHHNTFRATRVAAVVIRGRPGEPSEVHHNWFAHEQASNAVRQTSAEGNLRVYQNQFGPERTVKE